MELIHVLDKQTDEIVETLNYRRAGWWEGRVKRSINNADTFDFFAAPNSSDLNGRNRVLVRSRRGHWEEFIIRTTERAGHDEIRVESDGAFVDDLGKAYPLPPQSLPGATPATAAAHVLAGSGWQPGSIDWVDRIRTITFSDYIDPYAALKEIASAFDMELRFRVEVYGSRVVGRFVDLVADVDEFRGREIVHKRDLLGIRRIEDTDNIVTALLVLGPEPSEDSGASRLVVRVEDDDALERWGRRDRGGTVFRHLWGVYVPEVEGDAETVTEAQLRDLGRNELDKRINASVQYEVDAVGYDDMFLGTTVRIKDEAYRKPLYLEARIRETEEDPAEEKLLSFIVGDFIEYERDELEKALADLRSIIAEKVDNARIQNDLKEIEDDFARRLGLMEPKIPTQPTPPDNPQEGDKYINDSQPIHIMYVYTNGQWKKSAPTAAGEIGAETPAGAQGKATNAKNEAISTAAEDAAEKAETARAAAVETAAADASKKAQAAEQAAKTYTNDQLANYVPLGDYASAINELQEQIDGNITSWFERGVPTLTNAPANEWTDTKTRNLHIGDVYFDRDTGYSYRFMLDGTTYKWERLADSDVTKALRMAADAQETADNKMRVFVAQPVPPYDVGDLWVQGAGGDLMRATRARAAGDAYNAADWSKAVKYTDDTRAIKAEQNAFAEAKRVADLAESAAKTHADAQAAAAEEAAKAQSKLDAAAAQAEAIRQAAITAANEADAAQAEAIKQAEAKAAAALTDAKSYTDTAKTALETSLGGKADKSTTYTKTEVNNALASKVETTQYQTDLNGTISRLSTAETTITQHDKAIQSKASQTDLNAVTGRVSTAETTLTQHANAISSKAEQKSVDTISGRVTAAETTLTQHATAISSKAEQKIVDTLSGRVSTAESTLTQQAGQIESKVDATFVRGEIGALEISDRNLLKGTTDEWTTLAMPASQYYTQFGSDVEMKVGETYTFSIIVEKVSDDTVPIHLYFGSGVQGSFNRDINRANITNMRFGVRLSSTFTVEARDLTDTYKFFAWRLRNERQATTIRYRAAKLQRGSKATDWTPAPEDVQGQLSEHAGSITSMSTTLTQQAGQIAAKADKTVTDGLTTRMGSAESKIDANTSSISQKASQTDVTALSTRMGKAETTISANTASISQKASQTDVTALTTRVSSAETTISGHTASIKNKAEISVTNALTTRVTTAEQNISALDESISQRVTTTAFNALSGRVSTAESTLTQHATAISSKVDAAFVNKAVNIIPSSSGTSKTFRNVLNWQRASSSIQGMLIIRTPINGRHMTRATITGFNYLTRKSDIDLDVSFYNYTTSLANTSYKSAGTFPVDQVRVARYNGEAVAIIVGTPSTVWSYPAIYVDPVIVSLGTAPDSFQDGWTAEITDTMPTDFTLITNVPGEDYKSTLESHSTEITQNTADIKLKADKTVTDGLTTRMSTAESTISAHTASINQKASQTDVNGLTTRVSTAESNISANTASIKNKADITVTNGLSSRMTTAEQSISALDQSIKSRVTTTDFNALAGRVSTAETAITQSAREIELKVAQSEFNAFVDEQMNLIRNPAKLTARSGWSTGDIQSVDFNGTPTNALAVRSSGSTQVYSDYFNVDSSKAYEVTLWLKSETPAPTASNAYVGLNGNTAFEQIYTSNGGKGTDNSNFYFWYAGGATNLAEWTKITGYILPVGFNPADAKGLGEKTTTHAGMKPGTNSVRVRFLNWSNTSTTPRTMWMTNAYVREVPPTLLAASVRKDNVVQSINLSAEGALIDFDKVKMTGELEARHIKSLAGLDVGNGQFTVDSKGNVKFGGTLEGASGTFGKVTAGDGQFTLKDSATGLEYYATNKRNMLEDHSFELLPQDGSSLSSDSIAYNWIEVRKDFKSPYYAPSAWEPVGSPKIAIQFAPDNINAIAMLGKQSAVVRSANYYRQYVSEGVAANVELTVSAYFRRQWNLTPGSPRLEIWHCYPNGSRIKKLTNAVFSPPPTNYEIVRHGETFTVPSTFKEGDSLEIIVSTGDTNWIQCDGVQLIRDNKPSLYQPEDSVWKVLSGRYKIQATQEIIWTGSLYPLNGQNVVPDVPLFDCNIGWLLEWSEYIYGTGPTDKRFYYQLVPVAAMDNMQRSLTFYIPYGEGQGSWKYLYLQDGGRYLSGSSFNNETYARQAVLRRVIRL